MMSRCGTYHRRPLPLGLFRSGARLQTHFLPVRSSIKSSGVPAALPASGLHLLQR